MLESSSCKHAFYSDVKLIFVVTEHWIWISGFLVVDVRWFDGWSKSAGSKWHLISEYHVISCGCLWCRCNLTSLLSPARDSTNSSIGAKSILSSSLIETVSLCWTSNPTTNQHVCRALVFSSTAHCKCASLLIYCKSSKKHSPLQMRALFDAEGNRGTQYGKTF